MDIKVEKPRVGTGSSPTLTKKPTVAVPQSEPEVPDASARSYAARIRERKAKKPDANTLKGKSPPLGHVESPSSEKMEAIANHVTHGMAKPKFIGVPDNEEIPDAPMEEKKPPPRVAGVGSAYPVNQALATGKLKGPVSMREAKEMADTNLSPESVQALKMANESVEAAKNRPREEEPAPTREIPSVAKETKAELEEATRAFEPDLALDMAEISDIRQGMMSEERRKDIESRLGELDIADMIMKREIQQEIPVIPGKLVVTLRTFNQRENIWVLKYLYDFPGSPAYSQELLNTCRLVCGLVAINGQMFPDHRKNVGQANEEIVREDFDRKFFHVASFPVQLVADLSVQSLWFQDRVDKLFTLDTLKNG